MTDVKTSVSIEELNKIQMPLDDELLNEVYLKDYGKSCLMDIQKARDMCSSKEYKLIACSWIPEGKRREIITEMLKARGKEA
jgi:hypothetical protein